jgi:hypothetical protein
MNHHFTLPKDGTKYQFLAGDYFVEVHASVVGKPGTVLLSRIKLHLTEVHAKALGEEDVPVFFDWGADSSAYHAHIDRDRSPLPPLDFKPDEILLFDIGPPDRSLVRRYGAEWVLDFSIRAVNRGPFPVTLRSVDLGWYVNFLDPESLAIGPRADVRSTKEVQAEYTRIPPGQIATYPVRIGALQLGDAPSHSARIGLDISYTVAADHWEGPRKGSCSAVWIGPIHYLG